MHARDYTLLASQPLSVAGLEDAARDAIVISAVRRGDEPIIISLYGDDLWELWPYFEQSNVQRSEKRIDWSTMRPSFVPGTKAILYRYWVAGTPGRVRPVARSIRSYFYSLQVFVKWLEKMAIRRFAEIRPLHIAAFVEDCRARGVTLKGQVLLYRAIELLYALRGHSPDALMQHPWRDSTAARMSGLHGPASIWVAQTPVIPDDVLRRLFQYAETRLNNAGRILDERDRGNRHPCRDPDLLQLRNACAFLIGILSGMRCDEWGGITVAAIRTDVQDGVTYHWLKSVEHKTGYGEGEWMVPELVVRCVTVMERWSEPFRAAIGRETVALESNVSIGVNESTSDVTVLERLHELRNGRERLFLGINRGRIAVMSGDGWRKSFVDLANAAGVDWKLAPHQLRRTFVVSCAHHALGDLVYLKHHLKHRSLDMTALYALNPNQDESLFDEVLVATRDLKVTLIEHWLNPESLLAGGAAVTIQRSKIGHAQSRKALAEDTADKIMIRATGHGWCLAQDDGCGGKGLWEKTRCIECQNGLMDERHIPVWLGIFSQQKELLAEVDDLGPGAVRRVRRDVAHAARILGDLGVPVDAAELDHGA